MPAYYAKTIQEFLGDSTEQIVGALVLRSPHDDTPQQKRAWKESIEILKGVADEAQRIDRDAVDWGLLLEYPLLRLGRRLDAVVLARSAVCVIEFKTGESVANASSRRQVEDYALDLRDFHAPTGSLDVFPCVCVPHASVGPLGGIEVREGIARVACVAPTQLAEFLVISSRFSAADVQISVQEWNAGAYKPVPTIIEAASMIYVNNSVAEIQSALSSHKNLTRTIDRLVDIRRWAIANRNHVVCFVTGVPGSGKTLVGLDLVHDPRFGDKGAGEAAFLSGNSPLVAVLREALAREKAQVDQTPLKNERNAARARIQHLMSFLAQYIEHEPKLAPHEHVVVFDEAQRAWDEKFGKQKFGRTASEAYLFLDIMARHSDWAMIVALVGGGQEINKGEHGLMEWGAALQRFNSEHERATKWAVFANQDTLDGKAIYGGTPLWNGPHPTGTETHAADDLHLDVSIRSHRNEVAVQWIAAVLDGHQLDARRFAAEVAEFPIYLTRSLDRARTWLRQTTLGERRCGLLATSGARRLRGYGLGVTLKVPELSDITHWFLAGPDDLRSSQALEVTATEFACQGLEIDRACICWDHDMTWNQKSSVWRIRAFKGSKWQTVQNEAKRRYVANSYRVLLTRAREALVLWIPPGDHSDSTRPPAEMDATYRYLMSCGVRELEDWERVSKVG